MEVVQSLKSFMIMASSLVAAGPVLGFIRNSAQLHREIAVSSEFSYDREVSLPTNQSYFKQQPFSNFNLDYYLKKQDFDPSVKDDRLPELEHFATFGSDPSVIRPMLAALPAS